MIKKIILRAIVFLLVATGSALVVNKVYNLNVNKVSREMEQSTLPTVYCYVDGKIVNTMAGYTQVMSTSLMRDNIVPLGENHTVQILVDEKKGDINAYSYELRSVAGDNLIEKGTIDDIGTNLDGYKQLNVAFRMDLDLNQEYTLVIIVEQFDSEDKRELAASSEGDDEEITKRKIRYYTRVANLAENHISEIIDFAYDFHYTTFEKTYSEEDGNVVYDAIHPKAEAVDNELSHVSLDSSYGMLSWGGMDIIALTSLIPTIVELDDRFALIKFSYIAENYMEGNEHYYNVEEYYSLRYNDKTGKVEVLTFDRYQSSFFDNTYINRNNNSVGIGITSNQDLEYVASSDDRLVSFVKEGELWLYNYNDATLTCVFSYIQNNYTSANANNQKFDVNIDNMDGEGNIYFTVFGYMSRGTHEGENGISLFRYTVEDSKIEELLFVSCDEPYDVMKQEVGKFSYFDGKNEYYFLLDGYIYCLNIKKKEIETVTEKISSNKYLVSANKRIIAYPNTDEEDKVTEITIKNYETNEEFTESVNKSSGRLMALGFVENDLIYGEAYASDVLVSNSGKITLPLKTLSIVKSNGELIKTYDKPTIYIMNSTVQEDKIYLKRAYKMNDFFTDADSDFITYKKAEEEDAITAKKVFDDAEYLRVELTFPSSLYLSSASLPIRTKSKEYDDYKKIKLETTVTPERYYTFNNMGYQAEYKTAGQAIEEVVGYGDGLVVDENGNNIYRNQDATSYNTVASAIEETPCDSIEKSFMTCVYMCIESLDNRVTYDQVMAYNDTDFQQAFIDLSTGVGVNASGIELNTALYFLDRDIPFIARIDDGRYVLVISYNNTHIRYYDPVDDEEIKVTRKTFIEKLSVYGNTIFTFAR